MDKNKIYLKNYIQKGNSFSAHMMLEFECSGNDHKVVMSPEYVVCSIAVLQVKLDILYYYSYAQYVASPIITFRFSKRSKDCLNLVLNFKINNSTLTIVSTECSGGFIQAPESYSLSDLMSGNVKVAGVIDIFTVPNPSSALYDDKDLIDFSLKGIDGSVDVHRHIMAATSPVFKAMLTGPWREAKQGILDLKDIKISTIQHLKDYIYLNTVPEAGLDELIKLAHFLSMTTLVKICVFHILTGLTLENFLYWNHFAEANNISELIPWLLDSVRRSDVTLGITDIITSYEVLTIGNEGNEEKIRQDAE
ncbi:hypothetical protein JYU34_021764 [Plutella xylostella]|uniref:BTB domain-containing protein n=2 Tax=Plutella xylostella TaxID=51655 RepID=A0ABQ7PRD3_PLUXY|nr:hypothetical protein JYU34_021764 [Plutella xylostella]